MFVVKKRQKGDLLASLRFRSLEGEADSRVKE